jgi:hypothetical protein
MTKQTKHDRIFLQVCDDEDSEWCGEVTWCEDRIHPDDVKYIRADIATGYCKTVDDLRTIAVDACNKAWVEIDDLKQQLAEREKQIVVLRNHMAWALSHYSLRVGAGAYLEKALASTDDLSGYILCDAVPFGKVAGEPVYKARKQS